ncbi:extracellular solute-binding protein [Paenibacillus thermotolerans]|uniref:extracellular solute-binding protein n=1 Tax=Paenibacillus thermotolerans TaxID=3027807 RepID=UPI002367C350|nr:MULTISPECIES: extracellular solute-binding protein [unclassified Paenibacillus]
MLRRRGAKITLSLILIGLIVISAGIYGFITRGNDDANSNIVNNRNSASPDQREKEGTNTGDGGSYRISPSRFMSNLPIIAREAAYGYEDGAIHLNKGDSFEAELDVKEEGEYTLSFDYFVLAEGLQSTEYSIQVNGEYPNLEANRFVLPPLWKSNTDTFPKDRYGNEVMPTQLRADEWQTIQFADPNRMNPEPFKLKLNKGKNIIKVTLMNGELLSGSLTVAPPSALPSYAQYAGQHADKPEIKQAMIIKEAEKPDVKNDTTINPMPSRDLGVSPYETNLQLLNTIGGKTWDISGQTVYYDIDAEQDGLYQIGVKYQQSEKPNSRVFRTFTIDGQVPFAEAKNYSFDYSTSWKTEVLQGNEGPYLFYLSKGKHRIGIMADASPYYETIQLLRNSIKQANDLTLEIRKLVGNDVDQNRDWELTEYFPTIQEDLLGISKALNEELQKVVALNGGKDSSKGLTGIKMAVNSLEKLAAEPNLIPRKLNELNGGAGSVTQNLSNAITDFENQPLTIDQLYISNKGASYPEHKATWISSVYEGTKQFFHTFWVSGNQQSKEGPTLNVWLNRPRNYMELLQRMVDEQFTPETGIKVNFSTLPNEQRLTLAAASGIAPDLALGVSNNVPFDLGFRGAALDLRQFDDFGEVIQPISPGAILPLVENGKVYGLPETQDFWVLFYRKDILDNLNIPVPDTWDDVIEIMPELQRYGMNFYSPMAGATGTKPFMATAPFIYQAGGDIYGKDAFETGLDSKESLQGIELMTNLFKLYGLQMQVPTFYEHLRTGKMPLGVSNFQTYIQMQVAAPELKGLWKIAPAPGIKRNGVTERWEPGSAQVSMIFKNTRHPDEAWEFMKWWLSTETQVHFANQLQTLYGKEYLWNSANNEAFSQLYWPDEDKQVVLEQWKWMREVPKSPSAYIIERELSNIWTKVVFDGENIRSTVEDAVIEINKETSRKMEEFGYMKQGKVVVPYHVPTIEDVEGWVKGRDGN